MKNRSSVQDRRRFIRGVTLASMGGAVVHAGEGQVIPPTADGRTVTVKVDSPLMPGVRMSMVTEDLPPKSAIKVHLHQREDEIIFIRMGSGSKVHVDALSEG